MVARIVRALGLLGICSIAAACTTGACADAIAHAAGCGVDDLEVEDDVSGCAEHAECRSNCVLAAECRQIEATFVDGDRTTDLWRCYESCPIGS